MGTVRIVNDDVFLLGLDSFYRDGMKQVESTELLACAESVTRQLAIEPSDCPIEGYYYESPELTRYFRLVRSLQSEKKERTQEISDTRSFERLRQVISLDIYGLQDDDDSLLLSRRRDVVAQALLELGLDWELDKVLKTARSMSPADDYSLVGMACRFGSPHVVVALRESVALYAAMAGGSAIEEKPEYQWDVSPDLERLANEFIATVSKEIGFEIPAAWEPNAQLYYVRSNRNQIVGRCIAVGFNDAVQPTQYYHWAIRVLDNELNVEEFWEPEIWTTERYSADTYRIYSESVDTSRPLCRREGCKLHSVKLSVFCQKHHDESLWPNR